MAASSDADSYVVELRTVADVKDTATSARFFREEDGAGGASSSSLSWPERELKDLCDRNEVPAGYAPIRPSWGWEACQPPPEGSICVYADALEAGMRVPLHDFYVAVLRHYGLAPSQLVPNAWRYMAAFVLLCKDAGVDPMLSVFRFFFSICNQSGWYHFKHYTVALSSDPGAGHRRLFTGGLPRCHDWKTRFFLLQSPSTTPWPCPVKWGMPCRDAVRLPPKARDSTTAIKKLLNRAGSSGIDLMSFLSQQSLPVGTQATLAPEQRAVKVEEGSGTAVAAAGAGSEPTPTARKRKSLEIAPRGPDVPASCGSQLQSLAMQRNDGMSTLPEGCPQSLVGQFFLNMQGASEFAKKLVAEVEKRENELKASKREVTHLRAQLAKLQQEHVAKVAQLIEQLKEEQDAKVAQLTMTKKLKEEHDAKVAQLTKQLKEEHDAKVARLIKQLKEEYDALIEKLEGSLLQPASKLDP